MVKKNNFADTEDIRKGLVKVLGYLRIIGET